MHLKVIDLEFYNGVLEYPVKLHYVTNFSETILISNIPFHDHYEYIFILVGT